MGFYRKKPVVIEALQWTGDNLMEMGDFIAYAGKPVGRRVVISTLEGDMTADPGDWIIKGVKGEFYPCKDDIFQATYEAA